MLPWKTRFQAKCPVFHYLIILPNDLKASLASYSEKKTKHKPNIPDVLEDE